MFDSRKIDSYFNGKQNLEIQPHTSLKKSVAWRRIFKLGLPCIAAAVLGVMVVMPNIRKNTKIEDNITLPRKNEMEKLHIEQTVFSSTDNKNRINKIFADSVDETEPGSKIVKIVNPHGSIPTESGVAEITSNEGFFNQNSNILNLNNNVKAVVDNNTVITSSSVHYDFNKEFGWGDEPVKAKGDWGDLSADAFDYDKTKAVLTLKGYNKITGKSGTLTAYEKTIVYQNENKTVSTGKPEVEQNGNILRADKITAYFSENSKKDLVRTEVSGNVVIKTADKTATGKEGYYNPQTGEVVLYGSFTNEQNGSGSVSIRQGGNTLHAEKITAYLGTGDKKDLQNAIAVGKVRVVTPNEIAFAKEGHYNPLKGEIVLFGNYLTEVNKNGHVTIKQGDNYILAERITIYLNKNHKKDIQKAIAVGRVIVKTPDGNAFGDKGIYSPDENKVELFDNVKIEQNGNYITGAYAVTDLQTSVSRIIGDENTGGRIHGTFYKLRKASNDN